MKNKILFAVAIGLLITTSIQAQLGIRVGVNMANEITTLKVYDITNSFNTANLTGYQVGLIYQTSDKCKGLCMEFGALLSQKGSVFKYDNDATTSVNIAQAYKEINCINVPINLKYVYCLGPIGIYGTIGIYGDYALNGKTVEQAILEEVKNHTYENVLDRLDYGYSLGVGITAFKRIQLGANWSYALQEKDATKNFEITNFQLDTSKSRQFSVILTCML